MKELREGPRGRRTKRKPDTGNGSNKTVKKIEVGSMVMLYIFPSVVGHAACRRHCVSKVLD